MSLIVFEMPSDVGELRRWLETQIVGLNLADLVDELNVLRQADSHEPDATLDVVFGNRLPQILSEGLAAADDEDLEVLLMRPELLLELQECVARDGAGIWLERVAQNGELRVIADRVGRKVSASLAAQPVLAPGKKAGAAAVPAVSNRAAADKATVSAQPRSFNWKALFSPGAIALYAIAACLLLAFSLGGEKHSGLVWQTETTLDVEPDRYFKRLADSADRWKQAPHGSREEVELTVSEMHRSCMNLLQADHSKLEEKDRNWLHARCGKWAANIDLQLAVLKAGGDPQAVHAEVDKIVSTLAGALRERSELIRENRDRPSV
jgi:hypothetical protein